MKAFNFGLPLRIFGQAPRLQTLVDKGRVRVAELVFDFMRGNGIEMGTIHWNTMISALQAFCICTAIQPTFLLYFQCNVDKKDVLKQSKVSPGVWSVDLLAVDISSEKHVLDHESHIHYSLAEQAPNLVKWIRKTGRVAIERRMQSRHVVVLSRSTP